MLPLPAPLNRTPMDHITPGAFFELPSSPATTAVLAFKFQMFEQLCGLLFKRPEAESVVRIQARDDGSGQVFQALQSAVHNVQHVLVFADASHYGLSCIRSLFQQPRWAQRAHLIGVTSQWIDVVRATTPNPDAWFTTRTIIQSSDDTAQSSEILAQMPWLESTLGSTASNMLRSGRGLELEGFLTDPSVAAGLRKALSPWRARLR